MSIYARAVLGEPDNQIVFNDYTLDPVFRVKARAPSKWQIREQDIPVPFESGSSDFLTLIGDSAYIISGTMYPGSEQSFDAGLAALRSVCSLDIEQADPFSDEGYVSYAWGNSDGDLTQQIFMKPLYVQLTETTQGGFVQNFVIYAKIKDPTIFGGTPKQATTQQLDLSNVTGAAAYGFTYPVVFGAQTFAVSATATNAGTLPVYPLNIAVFGPVNNPVITNQATGESITINCNLNSVADMLNIIYDKDSLQVSLNGDSQLQNLAPSSSLFKLQPGDNVITLSGTSINDNAFATVNYLDGWPLA